MPDVDRELCRKSAAECVELARITADPKTKEVLLRHAQEWIKLAYSGSDARLQELLAGFNSKQLGPAFGSPASMQQQPQQQQQQQQQQQPQPGKTPDDETGRN